MQKKQRNWMIFGIIGLIIGGLTIVGILQTRMVNNTIVLAQNLAETQKGLPEIGGAFELVDKDGKMWKNTDFKGKLTLVYFGYTYCPDICPMALYHMTKAVEQLGGRKVIQPIFITLDPQRDTPAVLKTYSQNFHKDFVMLTGSQAQINQVLKAYRVYAARTSEDRGDPNYLMDHSSIVYLMGKDGEYCTHFNHQTPSEDIVTRVKLYIREGK